MTSVVLAVLGDDGAVDSADSFSDFATVVIDQMHCLGVSSAHQDEAPRSATFELAPGADVDDVFASVMRAARTHALDFWDDRQVVLPYRLGARVPDEV